MREYNRVQWHFYMCDRLAVKLSKYYSCIHRAYLCIIFVIIFSIVACVNFTSSYNTGENLTNLAGGAAPIDDCI